MTQPSRKRLRSSVSLAAAVLLGTAGLAAPALATTDQTADSATESTAEQTVNSEEAEQESTSAPAEQQEAETEANAPADQEEAQASQEEAQAESGATEADVQEADATIIDIAAISDFHGAIRTAPYVAGLLDAKRAESTHFNFVSAGDSVGGSAFESAIAQDVPTIKLLNAMDLEVTAVGNHEFDVSYADLRDRIIPLSDFPQLGANVEGAPEINTPEYYIVEHGDVSVAYIGTVTADTPNLTSASATEGLTFQDPVAVTDRIAAQLKDGNEENGEADVVVALMHEDANIVKNLGADVDLAIGGHTHVDALTETASGAPVCQPADAGKTISFATVTVAADGTVSATCENATVDTENGPVNAEIQALTDGFLAESEVLGAEELFKIDGVANRGTNEGAGDEGANRGTESSAGNLIAQAFYVYGQTLAAPADFGIMNSGGIRADFDPNADGTVTFKESFDVQPFGNSYGTRVITGADVYEMLEQQWKPEGSRPVLRLGLSDNVKYVYDPAAEYGEHILAVYLDGELLAEDDTEYTVASSSFLLDAGDGFSALANAGNPVVDTGIIDHQVFNIVAEGWAADGGAVSPDYTQRSFGYTGPEAIAQGEEVTFKLASLAMTSSEPKPETVTVSVGDVDVATVEIDPAITESVDESGKATVTFTVPADAEGPVVITTSDGSTVMLPVDVLAVVEPCEAVDRPAPPASATGLFGEATGDTYADVWASDGDGALHFYKGYRTGIYHAGIVDCDFPGTSLTKIGDVNGDNRADFIVRHGDGNMYFYYSSGDGFLRQGQQVGHGWNSMDNIVYAGQLGSGSAEYVVARHVPSGDLYRYTVSPQGMSGTEKIGHGWGSMEHILSVGNIVGDGNSDLIGIRSDGKMFAYKGHSNGTVSTHGQIGHGWTTFVNAFVPGDLNNDGRIDLIGIRGDGKMFRYANTGNGYFKPAVQIGHGWQNMLHIN